ncbi:MAG TPA: hypothetical protein VNO14_04585 [Blastocatellia bacterium]|nr:hypothetical protein [Blastocatellia bacterium]
MDRLGWAAGFSLISYGVRIGVRVNDARLLDRIKEYLPPDWRPSKTNVVERIYSVIAGGPGARPGLHKLSILYGNAERLARSKELDDVLDSLESNIKRYIAEMARRRVFVHAGVVGWKGRAIVIPGRTFSGKTTLVAELVRAGATYYSDEYAVFDQRGLVHPYARPLAVRENGGYKQTRRSVKELGGAAGARPLPVGMVVVSEYREGARWRPRQLTAGQGALALLNNTASIRRQPEEALSTLREVVSRAQVIKGARGEASEVAAALIESLGD